MSVRSELLFAAQGKILNPFLLCAVTSARARQLMVARDGRAALSELVDDALREIAAGTLEFGRGKAKPEPWVTAESASKENRRGLESSELAAISAATVSREAP